MDTDQILKGTKLILKILKSKDEKPRIEVRLSKLQYKKYKTKSIIKILIYGICFLKNKIFLRKVIVGYKNEKLSHKELKFQKIKK